MKLRLSHTWLLLCPVGLVILAAPVAHLFGVAGAMKPGADLLDMAVTVLFGLVVWSTGVFLYLRTEAELHA